MSCKYLNVYANSLGLKTDEQYFSDTLSCYDRLDLPRSNCPAHALAFRYVWFLYPKFFHFFQRLTLFEVSRLLVSFFHYFSWKTNCSIIMWTAVRTWSARQLLHFPFSSSHMCSRMSMWKPTSPFLQSSRILQVIHRSSNTPTSWVESETPSFYWAWVWVITFFPQ